MSDFLPTIAKLRRDMPRNSGVMSVCDELERLLVQQRPEPAPSTGVEEDAVAALEKLRSTKRKAQKKWYHKDKERIKRIAEMNQIKG